MPPRPARRPNGTVMEAYRHGRYNLRDQLGHFVVRADAADRPCHHHCCEGKRVHPRTMPVKLNKTWLKSLTPAELDEELGQYAGFGESHEEGFLQIVAEMGRREDSQDRAHATKLRAKDRRQRRQSEYEDEVYRQWLTAEAETNGYMLNKAGRSAGINERSLFTGPESRVHKYATPELMDWFEANGRPTRASWFGSAAHRRAYHAGTRLGR